MSPLAIIDCTKENEKIHMLEISKIALNANQPRYCFNDRGLIALADSIYRHGILQPLSVRKTADLEHPFALVAGERRLKAAKLLKMDKVPCLIIDADEKTSAAIAIIENLQRSDLNIFEEAEAIAALKEIYGITQEQIAMTLSVSQSYIANKLRILRLSHAERQLILEKRLSERHCRALLRIPEEEQRANALNHMIRNNMNVLTAEAYVEKLIEGKYVEKKQNRGLKDIRVFFNSIDRAVNTARSLGVDITTERTEEDEYTRLILIMRK